MISAEVILFSGLVYVVCGMAVGLPFVLRGVDHVDEAARGASIGFRLLILPGTVALWPLMATKWLKASSLHFPDGDRRAGAGGHR